MKVVIAPDAFKGTLAARSVAEAIALGLRRELPDLETDLIPMADGGEGTAETLREACGGESRPVVATGPLGDDVRAEVVLLPDRTAVIDMASASGLHHIEPSSRSSLRASSFGTGEVIRAVITEGAERVVVAVGGSASTDGGTGAATANGWRFLDAAGEPLAPGGGALVGLASIEPAEHALPSPVLGVVDVASPLTGPAGAARTFAPQKGATDDDVALLEAGLDRLHQVVIADLDIALDARPGTGAGGGMGAGLVAFFNSSLESGFAMVARKLRLEERMASADLVITGEGRLDAQSALGKVVGGVARMAARNGVPCAAIVGSIAEGVGDRLALTEAVSLIDLVGSSHALADPAAAVAVAAESLAGRLTEEPGGRRAST
jgi:glycerate 2-kinase